ncbi:MAG: class I SAM-dependent methyltransferase [Candidatus Hodarchaeales archaeon]|jgi:SAM-dependent methyltransferase
MISLERELEQLSEMGLSLSLESAQNLSRLHLSEIWAEIFWRRREQHATREDPELAHVFQTKSQRILEIGAAYGRVTRKIVELKEQLNSTSEIFGIELCPYFDRFFSQYSNEFSQLNQVQMIFDDFFSSQALDGHSFDVIVLPMNTFPSFPIDRLPQLFQRAFELLSPDGRFIFSTYKLAKGIHPVEAHHSAEIRVATGQGPIIGEFFQLPSQTTGYGARLVTYMHYTKLTQDHQKAKSYIFRTIQELIRHETLESMISDNGFAIVFCDDSSHSRVYGLKPQGA